MRKRRRKLNRNMATCVTGSRRGWETRLLVSRYPVVLVLHHVSLYREGLAGLPTWRGMQTHVQAIHIRCVCVCVITWTMIFVFCRLMKAQTLGDSSSLEFMRGRRVFEINPEHPIIKDLNVSVSCPSCIRFDCQVKGKTVG